MVDDGSSEDEHASVTGSAEFECPKAQKLCVRENKNCYSGQSKTAHPDKQNLLGNDTNINDTDKNDIEESENVHLYQNNHGKRYGRFGNVVLTEAEYQELCETYPGDYKEMIENLSCYMESTGKQYQNHFATLCLWAERDGVRKKDEDYYAFEEGECL